MATNKLENATLESAFRLINKVAAAPSAFLVPNDRGLLLVSAYKGNVAQFQLSGYEIKGLTGPREILSQALLAAIRNRKEISLGYENGSLVIRGKGGYKAEVMMNEPTAVPEVLKQENSKAIKFDEDTWKWIGESINRLRISVTSSSLDDVTFLCSITSKGAFAVAYDMQHMAFATSKRLKGDVQFSLPLSTASLLVKDLPSMGAKISLSDTSVNFDHKQFKAQIALASEESAVSADTVRNTCLSIPESAGTQIELNEADLTMFLDNSDSIYVTGSTVQCKGEKGGEKLNMVLSSPNGRITAAISSSVLKKEVEFNVDPRFLKEAKDKAEKDEGKISINKTDNKMILRGKGIFYVASLAGEG